MDRRNQGYRSTACLGNVNAIIRVAEPFMISGTGRYCIDFMTVTGRRVLLKTGAEGVFGATPPERCLGVAQKCGDGATRAAGIMMSAVLTEDMEAKLARRITMPLKNRNDVHVGDVRATEGVGE